MNAASLRLTKHFGLASDIAQKLVEAEYQTPRFIKGAKDEDLLAITLSAKDVEEVRKKIG